MPSALEAVRVSAASLPVIDISGLTSSHAADRQEVGAQLRAACVDKGFFYISNHGVSETLVDDVFEEAAAFFALPVEQKMAVDKARSNANRGYEPLQGQTLEHGTPPDLKEGYYIGPDHTPDDPRVIAGMFNHGANQWPAQRPNFRPVMQAYLNVMLDLSARVMSGIALSLNLPEQYFADYCRDAMATVRLLHYPPQPARAQPGQKGAGAHTDFGGLTLLRQDDVGGLQVWDQGSDGRSGARDLCGQSRRHDRALDQRSVSLDGASRRQRVGTRALFGAVFLHRQLRAHGRMHSDLPWPRRYAEICRHDGRGAHARNVPSDLQRLTPAALAQLLL
ncbi:MAG: 2-oxoglutarate and iron-dependent oxygenase domain-containing protein [Xanthobacteraceae bacterium]